jgi:dienelactone hydrolase
VICPVLLLGLALACFGASSSAGAAPSSSTGGNATKLPLTVEMPSALPDKTLLRGAWLTATGMPPNGRPLTKAESAKARPAVVLLHSCGGAFDSQGKLFTRTRRYADLLNLEGWHVLVLDSYGPRGERSACKARAGNHRRIITPMQRRRDALGALAWLAERKDVDASRLVLLGWSNGGNAVLAATNTHHAEVKAAPRRPRAAVAFYPGCDLDLRRGYNGSTPLLMLLGDADTSTPAQPCLDLAKTDPGHLQVKLYPGAAHGFDSQAPIKGGRNTRRDAAAKAAARSSEDASANSGDGIDARRDSVKTVLEFLRKELAP